MKAETIQHTTTLYRSEVRPDVAIDDRALGEVIAWADQHPHAWKIVTGKKSKAFGRGSSEYIGWAQVSKAPEAVLERLRQFHEQVMGRDPHIGPSHIMVWRAQFTFQHYQHAGFRGGFFQQQDAKYPRLCLTLDYTTDTLEEVIDRFLEWCGRDYQTVCITLDGKVVRKLGGEAHG